MEFMNYYICITNAENWEIIEKKNIWGVSERYKYIIEKVSKGDILLIYETKKGSKPTYIRAIYKVDGEMYTDSSGVFISPKRFKFTNNEKYPLRLNIKKIIIFEKPIDFKKLVVKIEFIKNKKHWGACFMGRSMINLSEKDYNTIVNGYL